MTLKELRGLQDEAYTEIVAMRDTPESERNAEWDEKWAKVNADYDARDKELGIQQRVATLDAQRAAVVIPQGTEGLRGGAMVSEERGEDRGEERGPTAEDRALALDAWCRHGRAADRITPRHIEACQRVGLNPARNEFEVRLGHAPHTIAEARALSAINGPAGGFATGPDGFIPKLELALLAFGGMRAMSEIIRTADGNDLAWPTSDDTSNTGELLEESEEVNEQDVAFKQKKWRAYTWSSKMVKVPVELLQDSVFNIPQLLGSMLGERIGRIQNTRFTTGTGNSQPYGIVTEATTGVTTASATAFTADEIMDLEHSVDPAYRIMPNVAFMMHDTVLREVRQLKDGDSNYVWRRGLDSGAPDTLLGYKIVINQDMSSTITATDKTIIFGDLSTYKIREVAGVTMMRLTERYAETRQEAFLAFLRADGRLLDAGTHPVKVLVQHA